QKHGRYGGSRGADVPSRDAYCTIVMAALIFLFQGGQQQLAHGKPLRPRREVNVARLFSLVGASGLLMALILILE
ncbi:hypothetical protein QK292_19260, partial [Arthrobacter sp. AL08]|uniref:hypothetical protein n=2 Tax=Micrococcaceae TaxID=1268 RepID=UPI00249B1BCC